jgi:hypothetical protein
MLDLVTLIDDSGRLGTHPPRVSGRTSFAAAKDDGLRMLEIVTNYVWAYGFDNGEISLVHDEIHWQFYRVGEVRDSNLGLWPGKSDAYEFNIDCAAVNRGFLAPPRSGGPSVATTPNPENPDNYYNPDHSLDIGDDCAEPTSPPAIVT